MSRPKLTINVDGLGQGSFVVDGHDISRLVNGFEIKSKVGNVTEVTLNIVAPELDMNIETELDGLKYQVSGEDSEVKGTVP